MPPRSWLKILLTLLLGFQIGLLLGLISSTLLFRLLPAQWIENGFQDRKARVEDMMSRKACKRQGFRESFDYAENRVVVCACWQDWGMSVVESCWGFERAGYGELGV